MIRDLGTVRPGTTLIIPFHTFDSNDPSASVTLTGLAVTDIEVYKGSSMTQRASDNGYTLLDTDGIDLDGITGIHGISIDLADNTTAGFWAAGEQYTVVISSVTVDAATINFIACTFRIGYDGARLDTTIASVTSQTSFTLTNGPAEDDALNGDTIIFHDVASAVQTSKALVIDYTGSTKTVTLAAAPTFTIAASDNVSVFLAPASLPGAAHSTSGGLLTFGTGTGQLNPSSGNVTLVDNSFTAAKTHSDFLTELRTYLFGADVAAQYDASGYAKISDGTGTGQVSLTGGFLDWNSAWDAEVQSEAEDALIAHRLDELLNADSDIDGAAPPTVGSVFHELMSKTAGSFTFDQTTDSLEALRDYASPATDTSTILSRIGTPANLGLGATLADNAGDIYGDLTAAVLSINSILDDTSTSGVVVNDHTATALTELRTYLHGADVAAQMDASGYHKLSDGTGTGQLDLTSGGALVSTLATQAKADVNAEVVDCLNVDSYAEQSQGTPAATASLVAKMGWLYMAWRNKKTQSTTEFKLFGDDASTVVAKSATSDDGSVFTAGEFATGP